MGVQEGLVSIGVGASAGMLGYKVLEDFLTLLITKTLVLQAYLTNPEISDQMYQNAIAAAERVSTYDTGILIAGGAGAAIGGLIYLARGSRQ